MADRLSSTVNLDIATYDNVKKKTWDGTITISGSQYPLLVGVLPFTMVCWC